MTTMAQSHPFLIPAGGQFGYQPAGVPAWLSAGVSSQALAMMPPRPAPRFLHQSSAIVTG